MRYVIASEGAVLHVTDSAAYLGGTAGAKFFKQGQKPSPYEPGEKMDFLLDEVAQPLEVREN